MKIGITDILPFCDDRDSSRPYLEEPELKSDGYIYATDGNIMLKIHASIVEGETQYLRNRTTDRNKHPREWIIPENAPTIFNINPAASYPSNIKDWPQGETCRTCDGTGKTIDIDIAGYGENELEVLRLPINTDFSEMTYRCQICKGSGKNHMNYIKVGQATWPYIDGSYLELIRQLANGRTTDAIIKLGNNKEEPHIIELPEIKAQIAIMPIFTKTEGPDPLGNVKNAYELSQPQQEAA